MRRRCLLALACSVVAVAVVDRADSSLASLHAASGSRQSKKLTPAEKSSTGLSDTVDPLDTGVGREQQASETEPATDEEMMGSTWCASGVLAHDGVVCCDKSCGQCGGEDCAGLPGGAEHCCLAIITSMAVPCSSYADTACVLPS